MDQLVVAAEIAERLSVSASQVIHVWRERYPDFPKPVLHRARVMLWYWPDVERWARRTGRYPSE